MSTIETRPNVLGISEFPPTGFATGSTTPSDDCAGAPSLAPLEDGIVRQRPFSALR